MSTGKQVLIVVGTLLALLGLMWAVQGNDFFIYRFFAPRYEETRREVFENTRSFNQGMVQELQNMRFAYVKERDPKAKAALASIILHRASGYNLNNPIVPDDLRSFIESLKLHTLSEGGMND